MCGIVGFSARDKLSEEKSFLKLMNDKLVHRGPDGEGFYSDDFISLAHKRLAIIDLNKRSNQPFFDHSGKFGIVFNGEIYNFVELKEILISEGIQFKTTSDTEVLLMSYIRWGTDCIKRFKGMFSFVIYDKVKKILFCARDHFGQKPFFYYFKNGDFIFSSELKSLISIPLIKKELCEKSIINYFHYDSFIESSTPIKNCFKLLPGESMIFNLIDRSLIKTKYWNLDIKENKNISNSSYEEFLDKLKSSVKIHLRSDVPLALYLSGGIDSTTLGLLTKNFLNKENIQAFNLKFKNESFNENLQALDTSKNLKIDLKTFEIENLDYISEIKNSIDNIDEPLADIGYLAIYLISKLVSQEGYKVAISGDGGDELLMGYEPFQKYWLFKLINHSSFLSYPVKKISKNFKDSFNYMGLSHKIKIFSRALGYSSKYSNTRWISSFNPEDVENIISNDYKKDKKFVKESIYNYIDEILYNNSSKNDYDCLLIQYQKHFLTNLICNHTDKANMLNSIEARSPFLDHELFDYVNHLPKKFKINNKFSKVPLRRFLKENLRNNTYKNPKKGFTVPMANWIQKDLKDLILDTISKKNLDSLNILNYEYIYKNIIIPHLNNLENNHKKIWNIFVLVTWIKNNVKG